MHTFPPKIFRLKIEKNQSFDSAIGQNGHFLENGHFWENGNFATNLYIPHLLSSDAMRQTKSISLRIMGQKMDILEMSILPIAPETFETKSKNAI
jgi:hypothetical protein